MKKIIIIGNGGTGNPHLVISSVKFCNNNNIETCRTGFSNTLKSV